jgi:tetratricopeptide (TPR) repeat protein
VNLALRLGDRATAEKALAEAERRFPGAPATTLARAYLEHARGDVAAAERDYALVAAGDRSFEAWLGLAQTARARGELDRASDAIDHAERLGATRFAIASERAWIALARGSFDRAEASARDALAADAGSTPARRALGCALAGEGRLEEAERELAAIPGSDPDALYDLARVRSRAGKSEAAREALARACAARPELRERAARDPLLQGLTGN